MKDIYYNVIVITIKKKKISENYVRVFVFDSLDKNNNIIIII